MTDKYGYVRVHRLNVANGLGRPLNSWEIVHHKNGDKKDNNLDNLEIFSDFEHKQVEALIKEVQRLRQRVKELEDERHGIN